jgi:murein L,D-transpeptidase YcbB/YkuD
MLTGTSAHATAKPRQTPVTSREHDCPAQIRRTTFANAIRAALCGTLLWSGLAAPAASQDAPTKSARALQLDADPSPGSAPDPLAPPDVVGPAPAAPGAPTTAPDATVAESIDPIVVQVRKRLSAAAPRASGGERGDYDALVAHYGRAGQPIWTGKDGFTARAVAAIDEIRRADDWGLKASAFELPAATAQSTTEALAEAEIDLALAVLKYARHARGGRVEPSSVSRMIDQKPVIYDAQSLLSAVAASPAVDAYLRDLHPKHPQFERLRQAMLAARNGGRNDAATRPAMLIPEGPAIKPGQDHPQVALLRQRLAVPALGGKETLYDAALVAAVKAHQKKHGLAASGTINRATRAALNGTETHSSSAETVQRLIVNMERWRWMPEKLGAIYVWDSIPDQMTSVVQDGKVVLSEKIVVGKVSSPTPVFSADMQFIIFHPSWGVPPGMKANELWPQLRSTGGWLFGTSASSVLRAHGLQVSHAGRPIDPDSVNWASADIRNFDFVQPPGPTNVLGIVKFRFPNKHDVYMHDTPERHLFGGATRAFSHGCMRVQNPVRLAEVLLAADKGWPPDKVAEYVRRGGEIRLDNPIPVHVTYFTAAVDDAGKVIYHGDIYGLDRRIASALEGRTVNLALTSAEVGPEPKRQTASKARRKPANPNLLDLLFGN